MTPHRLPLGTRIRRSPFYDATVAAGLTDVTVYNRMILPVSFGDPEAEYWRLIEGVAMWDVGAERQVEVRGPDARALVSLLSPRSLAKVVPGVGRYVPICDQAGVLVNDPVLLCLADDRFWLSAADSDLWLWARALATARGLDVAVTEPDVAPLAVQGPKAMAVIEDLVGSDATTLGHFRFLETEIAGIPVVVQRSGWSKQGGFEIYLRDGARGTALWDAVAEAGRPYDIGPGAPNQSERVESGLLSWGADTDERTNPFEVRMERYVDLSLEHEVIGLDALREIKARGAARRQIGVRCEGTERLGPADRWHPVTREGEAIGHVTSLAWSPRMGATLGLALVAADAEPGDAVVVDLAGKRAEAALAALPFL